MTAPGQQCYCGSGRFYEDCCGPLLAGTRSAATAEELMRSRYTAYAGKNVSYLLQSWHPSTRPQAMDPCTIPSWQGLRILNTQQGRRGDQQGMVEFRALYEKKHSVAVLQERSRFVCENGCWFYVDGELIDPVVARPGGTGRNAPCPCGSGKKHKKCCLNKKKHETAA